MTQYISNKNFDLKIIDYLRSNIIFTKLRENMKLQELITNALKISPESNKEELIRKIMKVFDEEKVKLERE